MKIYGIDFTSSPKRGKPITCLECVLDGNTLRAGGLNEWHSFEVFEAALRRPGPWIAGIDFPFGLSHTFIENIGWPRTWQGYVDHVKTLGRKGFRDTLNDYRANRPPGDKEHSRATDIAAGSISPQKLYGTPVGLMFFEGAPRLLKSGVTIPGPQDGDPDRVVVYHCLVDSAWRTPQNDLKSCRLAGDRAFQGTRLASTHVHSCFSQT